MTHADKKMRAIIPDDDEFHIVNQLNPNQCKTTFTTSDYKAKNHNPGGYLLNPDDPERIANHLYADFSAST